METDLQSQSPYCKVQQLLDDIESLKRECPSLGSIQIWQQYDPVDVVYKKIPKAKKDNLVAAVFIGDKPHLYFYPDYVTSDLFKYNVRSTQMAPKGDGKIQYEHLLFSYQKWDTAKGKPEEKCWLLTTDGDVFIGQISDSTTAVFGELMTQLALYYNGVTSQESALNYYLLCYRKLDLQGVNTWSQRYACLYKMKSLLAKNDFSCPELISSLEAIMQHYILDCVKFSIQKNKTNCYIKPELQRIVQGYLAELYGELQFEGLCIYLESFINILMKDKSESLDACLCDVKKKLEQQIQAMDASGSSEQNVTKIMCLRYYLGWLYHLHQKNRNETFNNWKSIADSEYFEKMDDEPYRVIANFLAEYFDFSIEKQVYYLTLSANRNDGNAAEALAQYYSQCGNTEEFIRWSKRAELLRNGKAIGRKLKKNIGGFVCDSAPKALHRFNQGGLLKEFQQVITDGAQVLQKAMDAYADLVKTLCEAHSSMFKVVGEGVDLIQKLVDIADKFKAPQS